MKTKMPLHLYFANKLILVASILAGFKYHPATTSISTAVFNQNLEPPENSFLRKGKGIETASDDSMTHSISSEYFRNYFRQPINEDLGKNEFDSNHATFYHRAHHNDFERSLYHPQTYDIRNFYRQLLEKKRHSRIFSENQVMGKKPKKILEPNFNKNYFFPNVRPYISLPIVPIDYKKSSVTTAKENFENEMNKQNEKLNVIEKYFNKNIQNLNKITPREDLMKNENFENSEVQTQAISHQFKLADESEILSSEFDVSDVSKSPDKKEKDMSSTGTVQIRVQRNSNKSIILNRFPYSRVYFEKFPSNLNLSWFVYVNCSRDSCLLSNSTNETELLNEGWIIHNCTYYGCSEMFPKTESTRKFIGLILLVFTLCVLKIMVFLFLFYYCRRLGLSKKESEASDQSENENSSLFTTENKLLEENHDFDKDQLINVESFDPSDSNNRSNSNTLVPVEEGELEPATERENKIDTKEWISPVQHTIPCLVPAIQNKNILIPPKNCKKTAHDTKSSAILKCRTTGQSYIPRLQKRGKCNDRKTGKVETKNAEQNSSVKTPKRTQQTPIRNDEILLMNLDDEVNSINPHNFENSLNWGNTLKNKSESFITINLNEETQSKL